MNRKVPLSLEELLLKATPEPNTGCWLWKEGDNGRGYGRVCRGNRMHQAHRVFYELLQGPIPDGYDLDHKCRVTFCVNPAHLEPVPHRVNVRRGITGEVAGTRQRSKTHCPRGHPYSGSNLFVERYGARKCKTCRKAQEIARRPYKRRPE